MSYALAPPPALHTLPEIRLRAADWYVAPAPLAEARAMVQEFHYSRGSSK